MTAAAPIAHEPQPRALSRLSPLERHVAYFDPDGTGRIRWRQTYRGMRDLGVGRIWSAVLTTIIHVALGRRTGGTLLTIVVANIKRGKHDSDSGIFDAEGNVVEERFEALFASVEPEPDGRPSARLTRKEMRRFMKSHGPQSALGSFFSSAEAKLFFCVAADTTKLEDGAMVPAIRRRTLRAFYDGTLLGRIARLRKLREARG